MRPTTIRIENFGLMTGEFDLSDLTLITGPNKSGKSTLLKALEFGLTGTVYDPDNSRNFTFDELTQESIHNLSVMIRFDNGFWILRKQDRVPDNGKVKIKTVLDFEGISPGISQKPKVAEGELKLRLNPSGYGLHIGQIMEAKTTERRKILLSMLVGSKDERPLLEWIFEEACKVDGFEDHKDRGKLESLIQTHTSMLPAESMILDKLFRIHDTSAGELKKAKTELEGTTAMIKDLGFGSGEAVDTSKIPDLETELKKCETSIEEISRQVGIAETNQTRSSTLKDEIADIQMQETKIGSVRTEDEIKGEQDALIKVRDTKIEVIEQEYQKRIDSLRAKLKSDSESFDDEILTIEKTSATVQGRIDSTTKQINDLLVANREDNSKIVELEKHVSSESNENKCPTCTSIIDPEELIKIWSDQNTKRTQEIADLKIGIKSCEDGKTERDERISVLKERKTKFKTACENEVKIIETELEDDVNIKKLNGDTDELLKPFDAELSSIERLTELAKDRIAKEKELNQIPITNVDDLNTQLSGDKNNKTQLDEQLEKMKLAEAEAIKKSTLEVKQHDQMQIVKCLDAIKKVTGPKGIQGVLLKERVGPFTDKVNNILHRFAPSMDFIVQFQDDRGKESCQFGFNDSESGFTLFESSSGMQKALILFAVVIALMNTERFVSQKYILMDNVEKFMGENCATLFEAAKVALDEKLIDFVMLAGALRDSDLQLIRDKYSNFSSTTYPNYALLGIGILDTVKE